MKYTPFNLILFQMIVECFGSDTCQSKYIKPGAQNTERIFISRGLGARRGKNVPTMEPEGPG